MPGTLPYVPVNVRKVVQGRGVTDGSAIKRSVSFTIRLGRGAVILTEPSCTATFLEFGRFPTGEMHARVCKRAF